MPSGNPFTHSFIQPVNTLNELNEMNKQKPNHTVMTNSEDYRNKPLEKADIALYKKVDEILWNDWDPIGVKPDSRGEYYGYLPMVFRLVKANVSEGEITAHLYGKETGHMGLDGSIERCRRVAAKLLEAARNDEIN